MLTTGTIDSRSELCVSGKTGGGSSNSNFLLLRTWDGEFFFFFYLVHWFEEKKGKQFNLMSLGVDVSKESVMLLGAYIDM